MKVSTAFICASGLLLVVGLMAGCDLLLNGNEGALTGVVGAASVSILLFVVGCLLRQIEEE